MNELLTFKAEFADDEIEILVESNEENALKECWKLERNHGTLFNLYLLDDDFEEIKTIL